MLHLLDQICPEFHGEIHKNKTKNSNYDIEEISLPCFSLTIVQPSSLTHPQIPS